MTWRIRPIRFNFFVCQRRENFSSSNSIIVYISHEFYIEFPAAHRYPWCNAQSKFALSSSPSYNLLMKRWVLRSDKKVILRPTIWHCSYLLMFIIEVRNQSHHTKTNQDDNDFRWFVNMHWSNFVQDESNKFLLSYIINGFLWLLTGLTKSLTQLIWLDSRHTSVNTGKLYEDGTSLSNLIG